MSPHVATCHYCDWTEPANVLSFHPKATLRWYHLDFLCISVYMHNLHTLIHSHVSLTIMTKLSLRFIHKILNTLMLIAIHSSFVAGISLRYVGKYTNPKWKQNAFLYTHLYRPHRHDIGFPQYHASAKVIKVLKLKQSSCSSTHLLQKNWNSICSYKSSLCPQRICKKKQALIDL